VRALLVPHPVGLHDSRKERKKPLCRSSLGRGPQTSLKERVKFRSPPMTLRVIKKSFIFQIFPEGNSIRVRVIDIYDREGEINIFVFKVHINGGG
jgi:hypothetical protein